MSFCALCSRKLRFSSRVKCTSSPSFSSFPIEWCNEFLCTLYEECKRILSDPGQAQKDQEETRNNQSALEAASGGEMLYFFNTGRTMTTSEGVII